MTELQRHDVPEEPKDQGLQPAVKMPGVCHVRHCSGDDKRLESQLAVFLDYSRVPVGASWKTSVTGRLPKGRKPWNKAKNSWPRLSCVLLEAVMTANACTVLFIGNGDEHVKNFSYSHDSDEAHRGFPQPTDLTGNPCMNVKHATTVNGRGRNVAM